MCSAWHYITTENGIVRDLVEVVDGVTPPPKRRRTTTKRKVKPATLTEQQKQQSTQNTTRTEQAVVSPSTKNGYFNCLVHAFQFYYVNKQDVFTQPFLAGAKLDSDGLLDAEYIKAALWGAPHNCPVNYAMLDAKAVELFFDNRKNPSGERYRYQYYKTYRSLLRIWTSSRAMWFENE